MDTRWLEDFLALAQTRSMLATWLAKQRVLLGRSRVDILTGELASVAARLEEGSIDLLLGYHHPVIASNLDAQRFRFVTIAQDRLVPVMRSDAGTRAAPAVPKAKPVRFLAYARTLALGRLVADHLERSGTPVALDTVVHCDSPDALHALALAGIGMTWLPWCMVAADCKAKRLVQWRGHGDEVHFEVRLWRAKGRLPATAEALWNQAVP